jgi:hypothetical protein
MASRLSPTSASRFRISRRQIPASTRTLVLAVATRTQFPALLLASTQTLTMARLLFLVPVFQMLVFQLSEKHFREFCFPAELLQWYIR